MTTAFKEIRKQAIQLLPPEERAELVRDLISSLDEKHESSTEAAWDLEIKRSANEIKAGKASGRPAENVLAEIRARFC